jgi:hypothetical protein
MDPESIIKAITDVTAKWTNQRKAEERNQQAALRRRERMLSVRETTIREAAWEIMRAAYLKASANGKYPAHARQIMYAARGHIQKETGQTLQSQYFCQRLLPDYMAERPEQTADWDVVFDARGHFEEPHTRLIVPLGTLDVRRYLGENRKARRGDAAKWLFKTHGPLHRFGAILFIEKEGFMPLFEAARLAERYDLAIMSTKGLSVTASRLLVDRLCSEYGIPLLVLHDFDKSGFSIVGTLRRNTRRYRFRNRIDVIDLGLRLADVEEWGLESEDVYLGQTDIGPNLRENGRPRRRLPFSARASGSS